MSFLVAIGWILIAAVVAQVAYLQLMGAQPRRELVRARPRSHSPLARGRQGRTRDLGPPARRRSPSSQAAVPFLRI